jgi:hypothetical protein
MRKDRTQSSDHCRTKHHTIIIQPLLSSLIRTLMIYIDTYDSYDIIVSPVCHVFHAQHVTRQYEWSASETRVRHVSYTCLPNAPPQRPNERTQRECECMDTILTLRETEISDTALTCSCTRWIGTCNTDHHCRRNYQSTLLQVLESNWIQTNDLKTIDARSCSGLVFELTLIQT